MRKFLIYFAVVSLLLLASVAYCNYRYDGTGVLNRDLSGVRMPINQCFCKMRHILGNRDRYDSFCFGSSRVAVLNLERINDGGKWYNMTYPAGSPQVWLHDLQELLKHDVHVSTLLIGIDDMSWKEAPIEKKSADAYRHPYSDWDFSYYMGLLFHVTSPLPNPVLTNEKGSLYDLYNTGRTFSPWVDEMAEKDPDHYRNDPKFFIPYEYPDEGIYNEQLAALREIKKVADENGIKVIFFMNPVPTVTYLNEDMARLRQWRRDIAEITEFYDFTGLNDINTDNLNFLETSHYREITGDKMIDRMMNGAAEPAPGFGVLVTKDNVQAHEEMLDKQMEQWMSAHPREMEWLSLGSGLSPLPKEIDTARITDGLAYNVESIDEHGIGKDPVRHNLQQKMSIMGWFLTDGMTPRLVIACFTDEAGNSSYVLLNQGIRPDLAETLNGCDDPVHAVFHGQVDVSKLPVGSYELSFLAQAKDGRYIKSGRSMTLDLVK